MKRHATAPDITFIDSGNVVRGTCWGDRQIPHETFVEGIDFIRGHHADDAEEVAALRAAQRLAPPKAMPLEMSSALFINGEITEEAFRFNLDLWDAEFAASTK